MLNRMLKPTTVFLAIIAVILIPMGVLSEFSTSPDTETVVDGLVCNTVAVVLLEAIVEPVKDADGNPTKACSDYGKVDCEEATVEYDIQEASTCNFYQPYQLDGYYWYCTTEKKIVPNGKCKLDPDGNCIDDTSYEGETLYYTSKCNSNLFPRPEGW